MWPIVQSVSLILQSIKTTTNYNDQSFNFGHLWHVHLVDKKDLENQLECNQASSHMEMFLQLGHSSQICCWLAAVWPPPWLVGWLMSNQWTPHCHKLDCWVPSCGFPPPPPLFNKSFWSLDWNFQGIFWSVGWILWRGQSCTLLGSLTKGGNVQWIADNFGKLAKMPNIKTLDDTSNALTLPF